MGIIADTLSLRESEFRNLKTRYPKCREDNIHSSNTIKGYQLTISEEDEESYFAFLLEQELALSSNAFLRRIELDAEFFGKIKSKIAEVYKKY